MWSVGVHFLGGEVGARPVKPRTDTSPMNIEKKKNANSVSDSWIIHLSAFVKPPRSCSYIIDSIGSARVIVDRLWLLPRLLSTLLFFVFVVVYL